MGDDIFLLIVGFILTSVLGGGLVHFYQNRAWHHQYRINRADAERQTATAVFEQLSTSMDKRLYRMRVVRWRLEDEDGSIERIEAAMDAYRAVLTEWNDNLNRNSALVERYFGSERRVRLERAIYEEFARLGRILEKHYHERIESGTPLPLPDLGRALDTLSNNIYRFNLSMIRRIQSGEVGLQTADGDLIHHTGLRKLWERRRSLFGRASSDQEKPSK